MKTQSELQELASELTKFKPCECSCKTCRDMCETVPCMGTPQEIKALIDAGHKEDLAVTTHWATLRMGIEPMACVMIKARERGVCSLYKDGKCSLHAKGLKPSEGKFASCEESAMSFPHIAATWLLEENKPLVDWIMGQFDPLPQPDEEDKAFMGRLAVRVSALYDAGMPGDALNDAIARVVNDYETNKALRKMMVEVCRELRSEEKICDSVPVEA